MKKTLSIIVTALFIAVIAAGCKATTANQETSKDVKTIEVNKDKKEVKIIAEVNGKYFTEPTRHGVVFKDGSNGEKSILRGLVSEKDFYEAMMSIGAKPGNNLTKDDMKLGTKKIEGSKVNVTVTWDGLGKELPFGDIVKSSDNRPMDVKFGGNIERAKQFNTGCILCLDSCPVGITSNSSYAAGEFDLGKVKFYGNKDVLPKDGTKVTVIFRLAE